MTRGLVRILLSVFLFELLTVGSVRSFEKATHRNITQHAFDRSVLGRGYLKDQLGLPSDQKYNGWRAADWLTYGSEQEDNLLSSSVHKFGNVFI